MDSAFRDDTSTYFEHPVPILPNFRVGFVQVDNAAFIEEPLDLTFYYNILDNRLIKADLGAGAVVWDIDERYYEFSEFAVHAFARVEGNLPITGLGAFGETRIAKGLFTGVAFAF
ncbi:hypothetical protein [Thaumasiovibrio sp. DFM-14]|uniref:hypothetical protein n=1 Tax=Thaumasiovibrio sp. DFM-14 TaxID=3384792 RepID=UPI0039A078BB